MLAYSARRSIKLFACLLPWLIPLYAFPQEVLKTLPHAPSAANCELGAIGLIPLATIRANVIQVSVIVDSK